MIRQMEVSRMNKKSICKWESTCDDDCRRPYGNCPENCQNYKPYVSIEQLEKENAELEKENKKLSKMLEIVLPKALAHENHIFYEHKRTLEQYRAELEKRVENEK